MYTGVIEGVGPRYCPSIEDKIHRFAAKDSHNIFLEPEGLATHEIYPNGISTSLPFDVQLAIVRSIRGLENCHILRPGYAIEYDYFDPRALKASLETRRSADSSLPARSTAPPATRKRRHRVCWPAPMRHCWCRAREAWTPRRDEAYLGVLVDDLITRGVSEPYRMFTSRAEYRLSLREDNADMRLTEQGRRLGLVDDRAGQAFCENRRRLPASRSA
jgi:tRNA uridine 5-carboxymethylaminomethyl modification enzyme